MTLFHPSIPGWDVNDDPADPQTIYTYTAPEESVKTLVREWHLLRSLAVCLVLHLSRADYVQAKQAAELLDKQVAKFDENFEEVL